jgi:H+/Cl- antiporter ClcA
MTPSRADLELLLQVAFAPVWPLTTAVFLLVDTARLKGAERHRAWPLGTYGNVVLLSILYGPLGLLGIPLHVVRTRRGHRRYWQPPLLLLAALVWIAICAQILAAVLGIVE